MRGRLCAWMLAWTLAAVAAQARAEEPVDLRDSEARSLFEAGRTAMADGRYEDSLSYFERAYELSARPLMLYNIGVISERLRLSEKALTAYEAYLREAPDPEKRAEVERRVEILRQDLLRQRAVAESLSPGNPPPQATPQAPLPPGEDASVGASPERGDTSAAATKRRWWKSPWLWSAIGVVVIGASVGGGVAAARAGDPGVQAPLAGDNGVTTIGSFGY